ncbi:MAG: DNA-3-methyladenine glycosylase I [Gammaproteobacteria bacterium]|nr:DNA-3-methyladenine glycosylase I [Gammaproteobacteria bacterium]
MTKQKNHSNELKRCNWAYAGMSDAYIEYHDQEWGMPVYDDQTLFEFLVLEGAQAGLSWSTILNKRAGYKKNFANFDVHKVARFTQKRIDKILQDPGVVRNKLKVNSAVSNAKCFIEVQKEFGTFSDYVWGFVDGKPKVNKWKTMQQVPASSKQSDALSKDLKKRGFKFVGSTIMYAYMQATGLVNDHTLDCFRYKACQG